VAVPLSHSIQKFPAGATIFKDGDARQFLYIVQKGQIAIYKVTAAGDRLPLGLIGSGEYSPKPASSTEKRFTRPGRSPSPTSK